MEEYSSDEMHEIAEGAFSEDTLEQDLVRSAIAGVEKQIAEVQVEAHDKMADAVAKLPMIARELKARAPSQSEEDRTEEISDGLARFEHGLNEHTAMVIASLRVLQKYRVDQAMRWVQQEGQPQ